jgi:oxygen-dependent protoporphyrinogen oxidase
VSGLSAAFFLLEEARQSGVPVELTLLEAAGRPGGSLSTRSEGGFLLEEGADSFVRTKPSAIRLCEKLGLGDALLSTRPGKARTLIVRDGRLLPMPQGMNLFVPTSLRSMVATPIFSWPGKLRMGLDLVLPRRRAGPEEDESVGSFIRRRLGTEALERLAQPMVAGIWAGDPDELSIRATLPQLQEMEREHRSIILAMRAQIRKGMAVSKAAGARYSLFLTLRRGMQQLVDALIRELPPGAIRTGCPVTGLERVDAGDGWRLTTPTRAFEADAVILALPGAVSSRLVRAVDVGLADELGAVPGSSTATLNLVYRTEEIPRPLQGYGFVCPAVERRSLMACTFTSRKYEGRCNDAYTILRGFTGGAAGAEWLRRGDEELADAIRSDLRDLLGITASPLLQHLRRYERVLPRYLPGHLDRVERIRSLASARPGLAVAGNVLRGVGISDCIDSARDAVRTIRPVLNGPA